MIAHALALLRENVPDQVLSCEDATENGKRFPWLEYNESHQVVFWYAESQRVRVKHHKEVVVCGSHNQFQNWKKKIQKMKVMQVVKPHQIC